MLFKVRDQEAEGEWTAELSPRKKRVIEGLDTELERAQKKIEEARERRKVTVATYRTQANLWLEVTEWDKHLAGFELAELKASLYAAEGEAAQHKDELALEKAC